MGVQLCYHPDVVTSKTWQPKRTQDHQTATLKANPKSLAKDEDNTPNMQQLLQIEQKSVIVDKAVETTPELVQNANLGLFHASMNLPNAAKHCGMSQREMKMTFREFLKYNPPADCLNNPDND